MFRRILPIIVAVLFVLGTSKLSSAMMCGEHSQHQQIAQAETEHKHESTEATAPVTPTEAVNVGNKICPVSGERIKEEEAFQVEHEGKIYNLCCKMCVKDFKKDPEKYIEKLKELEKKEEESQAGHTHEGHTQEHTH